MNLDFELWTAPGPEVGLLAIGLPAGTDTVPATLKDLPSSTVEMLERVLGDGSFRGRKGETLVLHGATGSGDSTRVALIGLGDGSTVDVEGIRRAAGSAVRAAEGLSITSVGYLVLPASDMASDMAGDLAADGAGDLAGGEKAQEEAAFLQAAAEGATLAGWDYRELKGPPSNPDKAPRPLVESVQILGTRGADGDADAVRVGGTLATAENHARRLQVTPGNLMTPTILADEAKRLAEEYGLGYRALGPDEMEEEGMGALLAVARGSVEEPRLIILEHSGGGDAPPLVLVGKGLTFDSGGISIKPSANMDEMKYDMSGGAAVIAALTGIAALALPVNVIGVVPSSENLPAANAMKPGDVIRARSGKTIAVLNTDAEGRLILCDALSYALDMDPAAIIDCATLTGAVVVALGHAAAAVLGTDSDLVDEVVAAGEVSGERCWPLPLWDVYRDQLDHDVADLQNIGGRAAGTITAACFLREFVGDVPWAHLDIAGTAYGKADRPYRRDGGHGVPTRLLIEWVRSRAAGSV